MPTLTLTNHAWTLGTPLGVGGFAIVYEATNDAGEPGAVKLIPKDPNAGRDLLFADLAVLQSVPNVVPIIDSGETETHWALVMPVAEAVLRDVLSAEGAMDFEMTRRILVAVLTALAALDGKVVHRDLKPENIMLVDGQWCLGDFGIARYAEATTASDTQKFAMTAAYAAPEQWRSERASAGTDIYAVGILAYEMLAGTRPFSGPEREDYREQHLHQTAPALSGDPSLAALITDCLSKAPQARPRAAGLIGRLGKIGALSTSGAAERLKATNLRITQEKAVAAAEMERQRTEQSRRDELVEAARDSLGRVLDELRMQISDIAPSSTSGKGGWPIRLGQATLSLEVMQPAASDRWGHYTPAFDVVATAAIELTIPVDQWGYGGRGCSLWFCDAINEGEYRWYEVAFMVNPMINRRTKGDPVALPPGESAGVAVSNVMGEWQLAWPFTPIDQGDHEDFVERWLQWFADAADGRLRHPSHMPERETRGYRSS